MSKQKKFKFTDNKEINEEITATSWKKAVKSFQNQIIGEEAGYVHTARSRNDQVAKTTYR